MLIRSVALGTVATLLALASCRYVAQPIVETHPLWRYRGALKDEAYLLEPGVIHGWGYFPPVYDEDTPFGVLWVGAGSWNGEDVPAGLVFVDPGNGEVVAVVEARTTDDGAGPALGVLWRGGPARDWSRLHLWGTDARPPYFGAGGETEFCALPNVDDCPDDDEACHCYRRLRFEGSRKLINIDWSCPSAD